MTDQVRADGARLPLEDQVVLLSVGTGFSHLVLVHLVQLLVDFELSHGTEECLDLHLVRVEDGPTAERSIDFARHFARFFDFTLHDSMQEAMATLHLGVDPTTAFVDRGDRDATARSAEELASVLRNTEVVVDLSDYHPTNERITTVEMVVRDRSIRYHGPTRRAHALVAAELTARGATGPVPSTADIDALLAHLRDDLGCTLRATSHPLDGTVLLPSPLPGEPSAGLSAVWSDRSVVTEALVALRRSGIAVDLPTALVDTRPDAAAEMLPDDVEATLAHTLGGDHLDVVRSMVEELWAIGYRLDPVETGTEPVTPSAEELDVLARRAHHRWAAQRLAAGVRPGTEQIDDGVDQRHPGLVPFDELDPATRGGHVDLTTDFVAALGSVGYSLARRDLA